MIGTPRPSLIQRAVGSSSGSPARNSARRLDRSYFFSSAGSCFLSTRTAVGALNITVTLYFSTRRHQMPPSGCLSMPCVGRPSYMMVAMPAISGP
jgi:hypothetical protein